MQLKWYHIISIIIVVLVLNIFKTKSQATRYRFLYWLSLVNVLAYGWNWWNFVIRSDHILTLLPLQLCDIAVILIPIALVTKKASLMDFVFYACGLGALAALLIVGSDYSDTYSMMTISFYIFHFTIFLIPLLNSLWGFHSLKPTLKSAITLTLLLLSSGAILHLLNMFLNNVIHVPANYFFTMKDLGAAINPGLAFFAKLIPYDYFYLFLVFPILYSYMGIIYVIMHFSQKHPYRIIDPEK